MKEKTITLDQLVRWVGVGLLVLGVLLLVNYLSSVLLPFFVAWFFAYLLYPMVKFVQYKLHVGNRALSIVITTGDSCGGWYRIYDSAADDRAV